MSGAYGCRRLEGRVALVVAATRGIGLACARALAAEGAEVYLGGRRPQANEEAGCISWSTITAVPGPKRTRTWRARMRNIFRPTCSTM